MLARSFGVRDPLIVIVHDKAFWRRRRSLGAGCRDRVRQYGGPVKNVGLINLLYSGYRPVVMRCGSISNFDKPRVLVVEDKAAFAAMLRYNFETHGFLVEHVTSGQEALSRSAKFRPHVVLLGRTLPVMCGIEVCRRLRRLPETKNVAVIMVGRTGAQNVVRGLNAGADDYVVEPFSITELLARIRALLRRTRAHPERRCLQLREIVMDLTAFRVTRNGREIHLGPTEFRLLKFLMQYPNRIFSREELIYEIWGADAYVEPRTVDVHVRRLRDATTREGEADLIRTVRTAGYALDIT